MWDSSARLPSGNQRASPVRKARGMSHVLTLVVDRTATTLSPALIARVGEAVRGGPVDILSPAEAVDIPCSAPPDPDTVRAALDGAPVDAITTKSRGRCKGLLVADMDSTIVTSETLDEIAAYAGLKEEIAAITRRSMNGEIDFVAALETVYEERLDDLCSVVAAITQRRHGARDVVHDAFASALRSHDQYRGDGDLGAWIWRIVVNQALDQRRRGSSERLCAL